MHTYQTYAYTCLRPVILNPVIAAVSVPLSLLLLATVVGILVCRRRKRERRLPDERDSGTDIDMVRITQVNDGSTLVDIE